MPLHKGSSAKVKSENIKELLHSYHQKGKIGNIKPTSEEHAAKIAAAIAYDKARRGKTNPIIQGSSNSPLGECPGGAGSLPGFLRNKK
jgi:hypothetical protein